MKTIDKILVKLKEKELEGKRSKKVYLSDDEFKEVSSNLTSLKIFGLQIKHRWTGAEIIVE